MSRRASITTRNDPYGRPFGKLGVALVFFPTLIVAQHLATHQFEWRVTPLMALGLDALILHLFSVWLVAPAPHAGRARGSRTLSMPLWRRAWILIAYPGLVWILAIGSAWDRAFGPAIFFSTVALAVTAALAHGTAERLQFDETGVRRVAGPRPFYSVRWDEVVRVQAWPAGIALERRSGPRVAVMGLFLDGYPQLVREVLAHVSRAALDASPGARDVLERVSRLAPPCDVAGDACRARAGDSA